MDEYHCSAYPQFFAPNFVSEINPLCLDDQHFNVEIEYTNMHVLNARKIHTYCDTTRHSFPNIPKDDMIQERTIVSWLSYMDVPKDAHKSVVAKILECARCMVNRTWNKHKKILSMHVDLVITRASEDGTSEDEGDEDEDEQEDEEDHGLVPAAKSHVEGLEMVEQEEGSMKRRCAICFEDFVVGVRMPCLHMFHKNCIDDWLQIGNSCPLCRFQMPTTESQ